MAYVMQSFAHISYGIYHVEQIIECVRLHGICEFKYHHSFS